MLVDELPVLGGSAPVVERIELLERRAVVKGEPLASSAVEILEASMLVTQ